MQISRRIPRLRLQIPCQIRTASTNFTPPSNASLSTLLTHYTSLPIPKLTLPEFFQYGKPPLTKEALIQCAEDTRVGILVGLARRVTSHLALPFLPATNPSIQTVHQLYADSFEKIVKVPPIKTLEDNEKFCSLLAEMVEAHRDNIPLLAKGFKESRKYLADSTSTVFLNKAIQNRITLRLRAESLLFLSASTLPSLGYQPPALGFVPSDQAYDPKAAPDANHLSLQTQTKVHTQVGILDLTLSPYELIDSCAFYVSALCESTFGVSPPYIIDGDTDATVGAVGVHIEYIMTELLKNSFRATMEKVTPKQPKDEDHLNSVFRFEDVPATGIDKSDIPPVRITIAVAKGVLTIRVRDEGGGIDPRNLSNIFSYSFTTVPSLPDPDSDPDSPGSEMVDVYNGMGGPPGPPTTNNSITSGMGTLAGLGFGLPLSRIYADYFGGSLDIHSLYGWGCDTYVVLRTVE